MRFYIFHITEFFGFVCPALVMMNETEDGKLPNFKKLSGIMLCAYIAVLVGSILSEASEQPVWGIIRILMVFSSLLFFCVLFTGGVAKILLSIVITDTWMGVGEILMTIIYCAICGKDLAFVFLPQYEGNILLQWLIQVIVGFLMLFASRKLFYKYRKSTVLEGRLFAVLALLYITVASVFSIKPLGLHGGKNFPYYLTLFFVAAFFSILMVLLGYNQNQVMKTKLQSLYLKQKMEREYALVFEDMDRDMRRFRHDVKKHIDALAYLEETQESTNTVPVIRIKQYQQDLKNIYAELTYGNYCSKYDVNLVLMEIENVCRRQNVGFSVHLKTLDLDSLSVHIRVQLFEFLCEWTEKAIKWGNGEPEQEKRTLSFQGMTSVGFHTLKISLQQETLGNVGKQRCGCIGMSVRERNSMQNASRKIKKLLYEYNCTVKNEKMSLLVGWHESRHT